MSRKNPKTKKEWEAMARKYRREAATCLFTFSRNYALKQAAAAEEEAKQCAS